MNKTLILCLAVGLVAAVGCGMSATFGSSNRLRRTSGDSGGSLFGDSSDEAATMEVRDLTLRTGGSGESWGANSAGEQESPHLTVVNPRKVIYTAKMRIVAADVTRAVAKTKALAESLGGYMQRMTRTAIEIRVPSAKFDQALNALGKLGTAIETDVEAADVTEEYVDLEIRLNNSRVLLEKLLALLDKAQNVKEALAVEKEISRVRTTMERLQGQLNVMKNRVAYSTVLVNFMPIEDAPEPLKVSLPFWWLSDLGLEELMAPVSDYDDGGGDLF